MDCKQMMLGLQHFVIIAESLQKYQERGFLCDTVLLAKCGGQLKAHAVLLAAASPVFLGALEAAPPEIPRHIYFPEIELEVLQIAIHFIYTGKLLLPTVYSHMDELTKLFVKLSELGLSLQRLHGCEMSFNRTSQVRDNKTQTREMPVSSVSVIRNSKTNENEIISWKMPIRTVFENRNSKTMDKIQTQEKLSGHVVEHTTPRSYKKILPKISLLKNIPKNRKITISAGKAQGLNGGLSGAINEKPSVEDANFIDEDHHLKVANIIKNVESELKNNSVEINEPNKDTGILKYFCEFCDEKDRREFLSESELCEHKMKYHLDKCHRCTFCGQTYRSETGLKIHMKFHTGPKLPRRRRYRHYKCSDCSLAFQTASQLEGHKSKHTGVKPWACSTCGQRFTMHSSMKRHQILHTGYKPFLCDFCGKGFTQNHKLTYHLLDAHYDGQHEPEYKCGLCADAFKSKADFEKHALEVHQLTHLRALNMMVRQQDAFLCNFCGKNLISSNALKKHLVIHSSKGHRCETCDKTFTSFSALSTHKRIHSGEKPYVCSVCHKGFLQKPALESHIATHSVVRPFVCVVCSKSFANKSQLNQHVLLHSSDAYTCGICNKQFKSKMNFAIHNRIHTGDKPHVCSVCDRAFVTKKRLRSHVRIHTGERPCICKICSKKYKNNVDLKYHYVRFHKLDFEPANSNAGVEYIFKFDEDGAQTNIDDKHLPSE